MTILVAVDEKPGSDRVVEVGAELAAAFDEPMTVLHVIPEDEAREHFETLRTIPEFEDISIAREDERATEIADRIVGTAGGAADGVEVTPLGKIGDPVDLILEQSEAVDARYVVVGGRRRSPVGKAIFGDVTQSVLLESRRPVVAVMEDRT